MLETDKTPRVKDGEERKDDVKEGDEMEPDI